MTSSLLLRVLSRALHLEVPMRRIPAILSILWLVVLLWAAPAFAGGAGVGNPNASRFDWTAVSAVAVIWLVAMVCIVGHYASPEAFGMSKRRIQLFFTACLVVLIVPLALLSFPVRVATHSALRDRALEYCSPRFSAIDDAVGFAGCLAGFLHDPHSPQPRPAG